MSVEKNSTPEMPLTAEELLRLFRDSLSAEPWNPSLNAVSRSLSCDAGRDASGWCAMPDRILTHAGETISLEVANVEKAIAEAHPFRQPVNKLWHVVWCGSGGAAEMGAVIDRACKDNSSSNDSNNDGSNGSRKNTIVAVVDSSDPRALRSVLFRLSDRYGSDYEPLAYTAVVGASMGKRSLETVFNLARAEEYYAGFHKLGEDDFDFSDDEEEEEEDEDAEDEDDPFAGWRTGAHFWGMAPEGSALHDYLGAKRWGASHRLPIQLDGPEQDGTVPEWNSYCTRLALLHLGFRGLDVNAWVAQMAEPHFSDRERLSAFEAGLEIARAASDADSPRFHVIVVVPRWAKCAAAWLKHSAEASLSSSPLLGSGFLIRVSVVVDEPDLPVTRGGPTRCVAVHVSFNGGGNGNDADEASAESLAEALRTRHGIQVIRADVSLAQSEFLSRAWAQPFRLVPRLLHWWAHAVLAIKTHICAARDGGENHRTAADDGETEQAIDRYEKSVQVSFVECLVAGGYLDEAVPLPVPEDKREQVALARQRWFEKTVKSGGGFEKTPTWARLFGDGSGFRTASTGLLSSPRPTNGEFQLRMAAPLAGDDSSNKNDHGVDAALRAWVARATASGKTHADLVFFGDTVHRMDISGAGPHAEAEKLAVSVETLASRLFSNAGLVFHAGEGPRFNHGTLGMHATGGDKGIVLIVTDGVGRAGGEGGQGQGFVSSARYANPELMAMQAVATFECLAGQGRDVCILTPWGGGEFVAADIDAILA